jgi:hypothetical protein
MWSCVDLALTDVSEERIASIFRKNPRKVNQLEQLAASHAGSPLADFSTLKMKAIRSFEMSVNSRSTQLHFPEDDILS